MANRKRLIGEWLATRGGRLALFIGGSRHHHQPGGLAGTASASSVVVPAPPVDEPKPGAGARETAVLAGGCFWGVQGVFQHVKGVTEAESGYAGGQQATADYENVSTGTTGHAESVRITYDPTQVSFGQAPAGVLHRRAGPHPAQSPGSGHGHAVPVGDLRAGRHPAAGRGRLRRPV